MQTGRFLFIGTWLARDLAVVTPPPLVPTDPYLTLRVSATLYAPPSASDVTLTIGNEIYTPPNSKDQT